MRDPDNSDRNFTLSNIAVASDGTSITATVASGKTVGTYDVVVTNSDSQSDTSADAYQVTAPAPTISSVSPDTDTNDAATTITISGTNFQTTGTTLVTLESDTLTNISCTSINVTDTTTISATVPKDKQAGTYDLKVTNPDSQYATKTSAFIITNAVAVVSDISPASMTNDGTQSVTITGLYFRSGVTVKIGTTSCTGVSRDTENPTTTLTCTVPADIDPGTYDVKVTNVGAEAGTLSEGFTVNSGTSTVGLAYSASDAEHVPAGTLTITATFTASQSAAPTISIDQQGSTDITEEAMTATADDKIWTYSYSVQQDDGSTYIDGEAAVTIKSSTGTTINITSGSTFTIDTASLSASITYTQGTNTSSPFKAGDLTIDITLSSAATTAPKISIDQQGSQDIADDTNVTGSGTSWSYTYTIETKTGTTYKDGVATVSLKDSDSGDATIPIGSGSTFTIDTTPPTVALAYLQGTNTTSPFKAGTLTITATLSENPAGTPQIALAQQGGTNVSATNMTATGSAKVWTYPYTVHSSQDTGYADGEATVTITNGGDSASNANADATNNTFTIDTVTTVTIDTVTTPTATNSQVITGTMESGGTVVISVPESVTKGTVSYPTATTWQCTISSLQEQENTITATATDEAGNTDEASTAITYDGTAPQVSSAAYVDTTHVDVLFSEAISGWDTVSRYTISGLTVTAVADQGSNTYRLTTSEMTIGETYTVVVSTAITDSAGNALDSGNASAQYSTVQFGDVDNNGTINVFDVIKVARASLGLSNTGTFLQAAADIDRNSATNVFDVIKAARLSLGLSID